MGYGLKDPPKTPRPPKPESQQIKQDNITIEVKINVIKN
jgi:hypothetical protein